MSEFTCLFTDTPLRRSVLRADRDGRYLWRSSVTGELYQWNRWRTTHPVWARHVGGCVWSLASRTEAVVAPIEEPFGTGVFIRVGEVLG